MFIVKFLNRFLSSGTKSKRIVVEDRTLRYASALGMRYIGQAAGRINTPPGLG